jgi:hypothetical protein
MVTLFEEQQGAIDKIQEFNKEVRNFMADLEKHRKARPTAEVKLPQQKSGRDPKAPPTVTLKR